MSDDDDYKPVPLKIVARGRFVQMSTDTVEIMETVQTCRCPYLGEHKVDVYAALCDGHGHPHVDLSIVPGGNCTIHLTPIDSPGLRDLAKWLNEIADELESRQ